jgi:hypothetical protein
LICCFLFKVGIGDARGCGYVVEIFEFRVRQSLPAFSICIIGLTGFYSIPKSGLDEHSHGLERFMSNFEDDTEL